jgi:hypothetical protein
VDIERRRAPRVALPEAVDATVNEVPVRLIELSAIGARIEHERRFPLENPELRLEWREATVTLPIRVVRSEVVGSVYRTGIEFITLHPVIASIASWAGLELSQALGASRAAVAGEDTWTARISPRPNRERSSG